MDTMIRDEHFWAEAPIYALHYDVHGMFALAEAALRHDGTDLYKYVSPKSGASLKKIVDGYLRTAFPLERSGPEGGEIRLATFGDGSTGLINGRLDDTFLDEASWLFSKWLITIPRRGYLDPLRDPKREPTFATGGHLQLRRSRRTVTGRSSPRRPSGLYQTWDSRYSFR
jgi:hypothetical protein